MSDTPRPRYELLLEALPDSVPPIARLKALLKRAGRDLRLKVIRCREVTQETPGATAPTTPPGNRGAAGADGSTGTSIPGA